MNHKQSINKFVAEKMGYNTAISGEYVLIKEPNGWRKYNIFTNAADREEVIDKFCITVWREDDGQFYAYKGRPFDRHKDEVLEMTFNDEIKADAMALALGWRDKE